jgi:hypothetical protein
MIETAGLFVWNVDHESFIGYLRRTSRASTELWYRHEPLLNAFYRAKNLDPQIRQLWDAWQNPWIDWFTQMTADWQQRGLLAPGTDDLRTLASLLLNLSQLAIYEHRARGASPEEITQVADVFNAVMATAYGATTSPASKRSKSTGRRPRPGSRPT